MFSLWPTRILQAALLFGALTLAYPEKTPINRRSIKIECNRPRKDIDLIVTEIARATEMGNIAAEDFLLPENNDYYTTFLPSSLTERGAIASPSQLNYELLVTCDPETISCKKKRWFAHTNNQNKKMNLCDTWFDDIRIIPTADAIEDCTSESPTFTVLRDFRVTKSHIIAHEWTHTSYGMGGTNADTCKAFDYAYTVNDCTSLAKGTFIRHESRYSMPRKGPMCPARDDPKKEGVCDAELAEKNADSLTLISTGVYYSRKCKFHIPIQPPPSLESRFEKRVPAEEVVIIDTPQSDCDDDGVGDITGLGHDNGRCALHVVQYQKENPSDPASHYRFDVFIFDSQTSKIGELIGAVAPPNEPVSVHSILPEALLVTAQTKDEDPVLFAYTNQMWTSGDEGPGFQCNFGEYHDGDREGDCSFNC